MRKTLKQTIVKNIHSAPKAVQNRLFGNGKFSDFETTESFRAFMFDTPDETPSVTVTKKTNVLVHSKFSGDFSKISNKLTETDCAIIINPDKMARLEYLSIYDLIPLETQRETSGNWAQKRLQDLGGLDMIAFGALSVAYDEEDKVHYVFDGCGRLAQAQLIAETTGKKVFPCIVYDISKTRAAFYFAYNQDRGRRSLSKEIIFVNQVYSGDEEALEWCKLLTYVGCYIKGKTDYAVPHPQSKNSPNPEIKYNAMLQGWKYSDQDPDLMRLARDMVIIAWHGCKEIRQDLFLGLIIFLKTFSDYRNGKPNEILQDYLNYVALQTDQKSLPWRALGGNMHNDDALSVAIGLTKMFRKFKQITKHYREKLPMDNFIPLMRSGVPMSILHD